MFYYAEILIDHGGPRLRRAMVTGESGGAVISESRKASQAVYDGHQLNPDEDPLL